MLVIITAIPLSIGLINYAMRVGLSNFTNENIGYKIKFQFRLINKYSSDRTDTKNVYLTFKCVYSLFYLIILC